MDEKAAYIPERKATVSRKTGETEIRAAINLDGAGTAKIHTGIGFFDHMLESFSRHGFFDLEVEAKGDLHVDCHHTVEDTGIVLGTAIRQALGEKRRCAGMAPSCCRWTKHWCCVPWICQAVPISYMMFHFRESRSADLIPRW